MSTTPTFDVHTAMLAAMAVACILFALVIRRRALRREIAAAAAAAPTAAATPVSTKKRGAAAAASSSTSVSTSGDAATSSAQVRPWNYDPTLTMPDVAIVGGGLAGLSCALSLQRAGIPCTVYERDSALVARRQGFGLTLTNNPVGALAELGVLDQCIREDCTSTAHWVLRPGGEVLGYYGRGLQEPGTATSSSSSSVSSASANPDSASLRIPREDLRRMLFERLAPGTVQFGYKIRDYVEDIKAEGKPVTITFEDGRTVQCDLLVGADGIHSVVRRLRDAKEAAGKGGVGLRYLEVAVILGISPATHPLLDARGVYVVDGSARLFTMPFRPPTHKPDGTTEPQQTMWQLSFACKDEAEAKRLRAAIPEELVAFALERTKGWLPPVADLISATPSSEVWSTPLYDRDPLILRTKDRASLVTVAGDAAHPMSMFKGQGANQALQDGPALAAWLRHQHSTRKDTSASLACGMTRAALLTRVRQYESDVVSRSTPRVLDSRRASAWYHSPAAAEIGTAYGLGNVGLRPGEVTVVEVLTQLHAAGIGAQLGTELEARVREVIRTMQEANKLANDAEAAAGGGVRKRQVKLAAGNGEAPAMSM